MTTCTRRFHWCSGHRVLGHENKCANLHGHQYMAEITACAQSLDSIGRVIDFGVLKERIDPWIQERWDHGFILNRDDSEARAAMACIQSRPQKLYLLPCNPTAENMAAYLMQVGNALLRCTGVRIVRVVVHETPNCYAEVTCDDRG